MGGLKSLEGPRPFLKRTSGAAGGNLSGNLSGNGEIDLCYGDDEP